MNEERRSQHQPSLRGLLERHQFLILRLHSLAGVIPIGAFLVMHLTVNSTVLNQLGGPSVYQRLVYQIHGLGGLLPFVEWGFIFLPILFHAVLGVALIGTGQPNSGQYRYSANVRYTLQRVTGIVAFAFIFYHVFHTHGWFHFELWRSAVVEPLGGVVFKPFNAASTLSLAMRGWLIPLIYVAGVLASVFHFANGLWTFGITWGIWTSTAAHFRAGVLCAALGVGMGILGLAGIVGARTVNTGAATKIEDRMYEQKTASGEVDEAEAKHKRSVKIGF